MTSNSLLPLTAAVVSGVLALAVLLRRRRSIQSWSFFAGMSVLSVECVLTGIGLQATEPESIGYWHSLGLVAKAFLPGFWLCFSLTYSRGNYREFLARWRIALTALFIIPVALALAFHGELVYVATDPAPHRDWWIGYGWPAKLLNALQLIGIVLVLTNLEGTFRASVGMMRWRIKFMALGLGVLFGIRIYTSSQALLFSGETLAMTGVEAGGVLIGCFLIAVAYSRDGLGDLDLYPSRTILNRSITIILVGGYLIMVGLFAQVIALLGGMSSFRTQAFLVLLGIAALAVLLLSDRFRQGTQRFISRHFHRPLYDFRKVWTQFSQQLSSELDTAGLCTKAARLISETFNCLSVNIWLVDEQKQRLQIGATTSPLKTDPNDMARDSAVSGPVIAALRQLRYPFELEKVREDWGEFLRQTNQRQFEHGGNRMAVPLSAGERRIGIIVLTDRVNGVAYTVEELDLLNCIGDQLSAALLNLRLTAELMQAKELEAFQAMSAFFVHDLKNAASTLNLMLQNLPVHFQNPQFREDALRGIAKTVHRINHLIARLSVFRNKLELKLAETDLNQLTTKVIADLETMPGIELQTQFGAASRVKVDAEQLQSVITNLLLNARDALDGSGQIRVATNQTGGMAVLSVADDGCGMTPEFLAESLFRPFHTTKNKGLGIGMFQAKVIVEAHRGRIQVESESGRGTTFRVLLPLSAPLP